MDPKQLTAVGLTEAEAIIYHSVLKLGVCTVKEIAKDCGFHRTNIYDVLEQLKEKGLITSLKEGKTMKYQVANPQNLYELVQEKKDFLDTVFPELAQLYAQKAEAIQVEVYKGEEGMKAAFRDMIRVKKPLYAFGVKGQLREKMPIFAQQWLRDMIKNKIPYYAIYTRRDFLPSYFTEIRLVSEELSSPVAIFIYDDKININIWEPSLIAIVVSSAAVAQMYRKHFDLLWKAAERYEPRASQSKNINIPNRLKPR